MKKRILSTIDIKSDNGYHKKIELKEGYLIAVVGPSEDKTEDKVEAFSAMNDVASCYQLLTGAIVSTIDTLYSNGESAETITRLIMRAVDAAGSSFQELMEERDHGNETLH